MAYRRVPKLKEGQVLLKCSSCNGYEPVEIEYSNAFSCFMCNSKGRGNSLMYLIEDIEAEKKINKELIRREDKEQEERRKERDKSDLFKNFSISEINEYLEKQKKEE